MSGYEQDKQADSANSAINVIQAGNSGIVGDSFCAVISGVC